MGPQRQIAGRLSPVDGAYGRESAMGAKPGRCVLSPATGCDGCGAKAAPARSTNRFAKINAAANRHQRAEVQRFYRRHDNNHHHIRQYASNTVDRYKIEPANPQVVYVPNYNPATVYGAWPNTAYPPVYLPPLRGSSLPIVLLKVLVIVWASPPPMRCSAA